MGILSLLTVLFVGLKLANIITWSWLWVLSPIWIEALCLLFVIVGCLAYMVLIIILGRK